MTTTQARTNDPDGFYCYSDHAEDIRIYGACTMCGSDDADTVGHVLPDMPRVTGLDPVEAARMVLKDQTARVFDGVMLDLFTAQYIVAVHDALSETNQAKLRAMTLTKAGTVCLKLGSRS